MMAGLRRLGLRAGAAVGIGLALSALGHTAPAQEVSTRRPALERRARIGVFLEEMCSVPGPCRTPLLVQSVVPGGPAETAGLEPGDTLLAIDGVSFETERGRRRLGDLVAGEPVRIAIGRGDGRRTVEVVPTADLRLSAMRILGSAPRPGGTRIPFTLRSTPPGPVNLSAVELDSLRIALEKTESTRAGFVLVHGDSAGMMRIEVSAPTADSDGAFSYDWRMLGPAVPRAHEEAAAAGAALFGYLWADSAFAGRLRIVRDSLALRVRTELDSLLRLRSKIRFMPGRMEALTRAAVEGEGTRGVSARSRRVSPAPESRYVFRKLIENDRRVAGAEFMVLTPLLAAYFDGVEEGLLVLRVLPRTPAARLGLQEGDVVVETGGVRSDSVQQFRNVLRERGGQDGIEVKWIRKGTMMSGKIMGS